MTKKTLMRGGRGADAPGYELLDAEAWSRRNPATFEIPSAEVRRGLAPPRGARDTVLAKLVFLPSDGLAGERMWVRVSGGRGGSYVGLLDNEPVAAVGASLGDEVRFRPEHVIDVDVVRPEGGLVAKLLGALREW